MQVIPGFQQINERLNNRYEQTKEQYRNYKPRRPVK